MERIYTEDDLAKMYFLGTRAGIIAFHQALIESGEEDGLRLRGLKERAKKAIRDGGEKIFEEPLAALRQAARAGK